jgi:hypothetical protein
LFAIGQEKLLAPKDNTSKDDPGAEAKEQYYKQRGQKRYRKALREERRSLKQGR